jgi:hypothetical protein
MKRFRIVCVAALALVPIAAAAQERAGNAVLGGQGATPPHGPRGSSLAPGRFHLGAAVVAVVVRAVQAAQLMTRPDTSSRHLARGPSTNVRWRLANGCTASNT